MNDYDRHFYVAKRTVDDFCDAQACYYHFFSSMEDLDNGQIGVLYRRGRAHGQSDSAAICANQQPTAGVDQELDINGNWAVNGEAVLKTGSRIRVQCYGNDADKVFTICGTLDNTPVEFTVNGIDVGARESLNSERIDTVTTVKISNNPAGDVSVGFGVLPADILFAKSTNGGKSWLPPKVVSDGFTNGDRHSYNPWLVRLPNGNLVAFYAVVDISPSFAPLWKRSVSTDLGQIWTEDEEDVTIEGESPGRPPLYGPINVLSDGRLVMAGYNGSNWVVISSDEGRTWTKSIMVGPAALPAVYTECSIACIDDENWIAVVRVDGGVETSWRQFKTTDGGATSPWIPQGETNLVPSVEYASPRLRVHDYKGQRYLILTYCIRDHQGPVTTPVADAIYSRTATATDALASAKNWGEPQIIIRDLSISGKNHGYQEWLPRGNRLLVLYSEETGTFTSVLRGTISEAVI